MIRRMIVVIGTLFGFLAVAPAVHAATTIVSTDAARYRPGDTVTAFATGFTACKGKTITFTFTPPGNDSSIPKYSTVNNAGEATVSFVIPNKTGNWRLSAAATGCVTARTTFVASRPVYPPGQDDGPQVAADASIYTPGSGGSLTVTGFEACVGQPITFTITPPGGGTPLVLVGTVLPDGTATVNFGAQGPIGSYGVVAHSDGCVDAEVGFVVGRLPATGSDMSATLRTAAIAGLAGCGLVLVAWRRRRSTALAH